MVISKKKILFYFIKGDTDGGSDYSLFALLNHLDLNKYTPIIIYRKFSSLVGILEEKKFEVIYLPEKSKPKVKSKTGIKSAENIKSRKNYPLKKYLISIKVLLKSVPEALKLIKIIKSNNIDIIHLNHNLNGDRAGVIAGIITGIKIISHYRGLYNPVPIDLFLSNYIDKIICISNFTKEEYINYGIDKNKCTTIYNGVDTNSFYPIPKTNDNLIIGCVGRLENWKGQHVLLQALPSILRFYPQIKVQFIGGGSNRKELENMALELGVLCSVEFIGSVDNIKEYIKEFSIAVHTSIKPEPFGRVIIEAMAMGKVVIATNIGGPKEIITDGVNGFLIPANDSAVLANKIIYLLKDSKLLKNIENKALMTIKSKFDSSIVNKKIEMFYEKN